MIGTLVHAGGPAPLRASITYSYPFELYAAHLPEWKEHCLRLPWAQRGPFDDVGDVVHGEQEAFVQELLVRCGIPQRTAAPGEHVFPTAHEAVRAAAVLSAALGIQWGLTFALDDRTVWIDLARRTPALVVRWEAGVEGVSDELVIGLDLALTDRGARVASAFVDARMLELARDAVRAAPARAPERRDELVRTWSRTIHHGAIAGDRDETVALEIRPSGATLRTLVAGDHDGERERSYAPAEVASDTWAPRDTFRTVAPRIDAFIRELARLTP